MHIAFYVDSNGGTPQNTEIYNALNEAVETQSVTDAMENAHAASNIVNKFKLSYLYSEQDKDRFGIFQLFNLAQSVPIITNSKEERDEVFRLTGIEPLQLEKFNIKEMVKVWS